MEVVSAQLEEIKEVTLQNAAGKGIISQAVDGMTNPDVPSTIQKAVTSEVKEKTEIDLTDIAIIGEKAFSGCTDTIRHFRKRQNY